MLYTQLPDEFDTGAISLVFDAARSRPVDPRAACIAAMNVVGYAADKTLPPPGAPVRMASPVSAGAEPQLTYTEDQRDEAFGKLISANVPVGAAAAPVNSVDWNRWLAIVVDVATRLLPLLLKTA
jgi:hypothetical protein